MTTQTTPETPVNPNGCDENHCFCDRFDEHGEIDCTLDQWQVIPPTRPLTLEERLQRIISLCEQSEKLAKEIAASL
jgi:hypothetical protein